MRYACLLLILSLHCIAGLRAGAATGPAETAPAWDLSDVDGNRVSLADYKGKVVVLNFWETVCAPCRKEIPDLVALHQQFGARGLVIVGAAMDRKSGVEVKAMAKKLSVDYPVGLAPASMIRSYGVIGAPTTIVIGRDGNIAFRHVGVVSREELEKQLKPLL